MPLEALPGLVLVLRHFHPAAIDLAPGWNWRHWRHQVGGLSCTQMSFTCLLLEPQPAIYEAIAALDERWQESQLGAFGPISLDEATEYRDWVRTHLGADCTWQWGALTEAYYPLDCPTAAAAQRLTLTPLPDDLDELLVARSPLGLTMGMLNRWELAILTENSD